MSSALFWQFMRYSVSGAASLLAYIGLLWLLMEATSLPGYIVNAVAYVATSSMNYILNYFWSFDSSEKHSSATKKFLVISLCAAVLNSAFVAALAGTGVSIIMAGFTFSLLWSLVSFITQKLWAFRA